ncbi:hypothetical protein HYV79_00675 [Candidatus Woesearchaeota archaeon]|nr:hypothetical protein [Candidatus Woesearchaeota archaeon]
MSFIRIKKIKGQNYAYLVKNTWTKKGCRQNVGKYIGKVINCKKLQNDHTLTKETYSERILEIIQQELLNHGFKTETNNLVFEDISISINPLNVKKKNKNIALQINEGFMCQETLQQLQEFMPKSEKDLEKLAVLLVEAGIKLNQNIFLQLCEPLIAKSKEQENSIDEFYY